jgi:hypothetical protein
VKNLAPGLAQSNATVAVAFMRRIGAPEWRLMVDARVRAFGDRTQEKMAGVPRARPQAGEPAEGRAGGDLSQCRHP